MPEMHQGGVVITVPPHYPTPDKRETVTMLAAFGLTIEQIAQILKCTTDDVRKWYQNELDTGLVRINSQVKAALLHQALYKEDVAAMRLWLINNAGWVSGDGGRRLQPPGDGGELPGEGEVHVVQRRTVIEQILTRVTREKRDGEKVIEGRVVAAPARVPANGGANGQSHGANGNGAAKKTNGNGNGNGSGYK